MKMAVVMMVVVDLVGGEQDQTGAVGEGGGLPLPRQLRLRAGHEEDGVE